MEGGLNFLKVLVRAGSMGFEKVIKLVIKIFTWFYQKWIIKIKIKSANKIELRWILKRFNIWLQLRYLAESRISFNFWPSAFAECENAAWVIQCKKW